MDNSLSLAIKDVGSGTFSIYDFFHHYLILFVHLFIRLYFFVLVFYDFMHKWQIQYESLAYVYASNAHVEKCFQKLPQ